MAVDVEAAAPDEADHGQAEAVGGLHGQARGRRHGADQRDAGHGGLLDQLEAHPAGEHQHLVRQRKFAGQQRPADELVDGVVAADVLPNGHRLTGPIEGAGGVEPSGLLEDPLGPPEPVGQLFVIFELPENSTIYDTIWTQVSVTPAVPLKTSLCLGK